MCSAAHVGLVLKNHFMSLIGAESVCLRSVSGQVLQHYLTSGSGTRVSADAEWSGAACSMFVNSTQLARNNCWHECVLLGS
jgi:hypothetical protein